MCMQENQSAKQVVYYNIWVGIGFSIGALLLGIILRLFGLRLVGR